MTREFEETKVDFLGPIYKAPWKKILVPCQQDSQQPYLVNKEISSWMAQEFQDTLGPIREEKFTKICKYYR